MNLIMTDYSMPGMTGYELLKKIKVRVSPFAFKSSLYMVFKILRLMGLIYVQESSAFREIPVVIMSSENILARIDRYPSWLILVFSTEDCGFVRCSLITLRQPLMM